MAVLADEIYEAANTLGLKVDIGFSLSFDGTKLRAVARLPELGSGNGMLVFTSDDHLSPEVRERLRRADYGYSVIGALQVEQQFDLDSWREVFIDWGWNSKFGPKPKWMTEPSLDDLEKAMQDATDHYVRTEIGSQIALLHWEDERAQEVLFGYIKAGVLDADPLADLWIRRGKIDRSVYDELASDDLRQLLAPWFRELKH